MKTFLKKIPTGLPSLIVVAVVTYLSLASNPLQTKDLPLFPGADKLAHAVMYMGLAGVFIFDYAKHILPHHTKLNVELALTISASLLGLMLEIAQLVMHNGRGYEFMDWVADTVGAALAWLIIRYWLMHRFRRYFLRHHRHHHAHGRHLSRHDRASGNQA